MALLIACRGNSTGDGRSATPPAGSVTDAAVVPPSISPIPITPTASSEDAIGSPAIDGQRAYRHVQKLAVEIGPRVAGTPSEITARDYLRSTLASYGYDVTVQDFGFDASAFLPVRIEIAGGDAIPGIALRGSAVGSASGRLIAAGIGRSEDYPPGGASGAIVLVERGELMFTDKVANAVAAGATGIIVYNNQPGRLIADLTGTGSIPAAGITQAAGEQLVQTLGTNAELRTATITVSPPKGTAYNVVAKPRGVTTCVTVTGGHYDSVAVTGGADDNASGSAAVLELARVVAARNEQGANCFVLFSAEEFGLFGSRSYVEQMSAADKNSLRAMINLDVVGVAGGLQLIGSDDLIDVARLRAQALGIEATPSTLPVGAGSDHLSFQNAGVPVVMLYREDNVIHTPADDISRIVPESLAATVAVALVTMEQLSPGCSGDVPIPCGVR